MSNQHEEALRIHQEQIQQVLKAEQDLIALQNQKHAFESGQVVPQAHKEPPTTIQTKHDEPSDLQQHAQIPAEPSFCLRKLVIQLIEARNLTSSLLPLDPYILIQAGSERHQTPAFKNAGSNPTFNQFEIHCLIVMNVDCLEFEVYDQHKLGSDPVLGRGQVLLHKTRLFQGHTCDTWVPLFRNAFQHAGEVHVVLIPHA